jgi:hypothetical protein
MMKADEILFAVVRDKPIENGNVVHVQMSLLKSPARRSA